jgi:hypothetical protein
LEVTIDNDEIATAGAEPLELEDTQVDEQHVDSDDGNMGDIWSFV